MAIVQISQITNRKGLQTDLPQPLAGAEFGWSTDTRQLWIGNGTLAEGAPVEGNTEILTEFSDIIVAAKYTYSGEEATGYAVQTGPTPSNPTVISQQNWMDQFATVKDFGAKGDGVTDDTAAINRAFEQLYCNQSFTEPAVRRSLFFPAGTYLITDTINIPTYATVYGEGPDNTIILGTGTAQYVAQFADSFFQTGSNIATTGGTAPIDIHISNMQFQNVSGTTDVFLIDSASRCKFTNVAFIGPKGTGSLSSVTDATTAVVFANTVTGITTNSIQFEDCLFAGVTWAINNNIATNSILINNSEFNTLYQGIVLSAAGSPGPTGWRITNSVFDNIYSSGVLIGSPGGDATTLNATAYNTFYDVGNSFGGSTSPTAVIIAFYSNNNYSVGDMFQRTAANSRVYERVLVDGQYVIASTNGEKIEMGTYTRQSGLVAPVPGTFDIDVTNNPTFTMNYSIQTAGNGYRVGSYLVATAGNGVITTSDDYTENLPTTIVLTATQPNVSTVRITSTSAANTGAIYYSINYLK